VTARHRDGHEFPAELTVSVVRWQGGQFVNAFARDISARKRAERRRALQQAVTRALRNVTSSW
jgi:PAS domain S-box-containing protein